MGKRLDIVYVNILRHVHQPNETGCQLHASRFSQPVTLPAFNTIMHIYNQSPWQPSIPHAGRTKIVIAESKESMLERSIRKLSHYYSDSVWHCFVFDPLRVVRAKLFRIVHSSVTRSFIRGAWRGSCDTSLPHPIIHFDFTDVSDLRYDLPSFGHFTIYLCHASLAQKRCKLFYVYINVSLTI